MDETQPLLQHTNDSDNHAQPGPHGSKDIVDFDPNGDPENPLEWPTNYKLGIVALQALMAFTTTFTCISVMPVATDIVRDLDGVRSKSASVLLVTIWELGEAAGPLLIAPLSEVFGRYPVFNVANLGFIAATILAALSPSTPVLITSRFLNGLAVASNVLNPAVVGDIFVTEQRGSAMSAITVAPLIGGAIGPAISGAIAQSVGWRAVLWMCVGLASFCELVFLTCFRETYKVTILARKAARLRQETGNAALRTPFELEDEQGASRVWESVMRPVVILIGSPVLQAMSLFGSVFFTYYYIMSTTLPDIMMDIYGLNPANSGLAFLANSVGSFVSVTACNLFLDKIYIKLRNGSKSGVGQPEYRLPFCIAGGIALPVVVAAYGWAAQLHSSLVLQLVTVALLGTILLLGFLPIIAYIVDAFGLYSASAMTAVIVIRCVVGTFLPLLTGPLVGEMGYGWAFTILAAIAASTAPIPIVVMRYGHRWRQGSKYT